MKISILITSYNKGKYIERCIVSCLKQNFTSFEIILVDNYSSDKTSSILKNYKNKIKIIYKKKISKYGSLNQINLIKYGLKKCKGKIICLLDGDDYFKENKIDAVYNCFIKSKKKVIFDSPYLLKNKKIKKIILKEKFQKHIWPQVINTSSISIEKKFLEKILKRYTFNKYYLLEIDFIINVLSRNIYKNCKIINNYISIYRSVDNSIMSDQEKYSKKWFLKRGQAHSFMKKIYKTKKKKYNNFFDKNLTKLVNIIFNY
ncbi:MAG: glycosyltransferase family 2 protein [Candidatus Pelagibacter sp. TMED118]|nr:MAG: glycosyltransferase family 2 protein [Candidatus Pelagibacter sp. TMED118]|tara:strand:+ start:105 stop:881 length:777 start_codon:yes stop_codon:yes gene_type:complete